MDPASAALLADLLLVLHAMVVLFVVGGLAAILLGAALGWRWIRNPWFRLAHLGTIAFVVIQTWLGELCPLTVWEQALRDYAGQPAYQGSFIAHWLDRLLYVEAPWWVFIVAYTLFGLAVLATFLLVPPRFRGKAR